MVSVAEMTAIVGSLYQKQSERLVQSLEGFEQFLERPEEKAVTFEIDCYESLIEHAQTAA